MKSTAEERVGRRCANLRVLNSYWINQDSTYKYFEIILVDPQHRVIRQDPRINWIVNPVHKVRERCMIWGKRAIADASKYSTASLVALPLRERSLVVWVRVTNSTRQPQAGERLGNGTTPFHYGVIVRCARVAGWSVFEFSATDRDVNLGADGSFNEIKLPSA